jgi:hypothetical protein
LALWTKLLSLKKEEDEDEGEDSMSAEDEDDERREEDDEERCKAACMVFAFSALAGSRVRRRTFCGVRNEDIL